MERSFRAPRPYVPLPARLAVLLSGRGSNFVALAEACASGGVPGEVVLVVSDRANAAGLQKAAERGIPTRILERASYPSRDAYEDAVWRNLQEVRADLVCLAGFMRILSPAFVERLAFRILNVHPSLLPAFPGLEAQAQAIRYGARISGATVHFVDAGMDTGTVVRQESILILPSDDQEVLAARILEIEHRIYAKAVCEVLEGGWSVVGRRFLPARIPP